MQVDADVGGLTAALSANASINIFKLENLLKTLGWVLSKAELEVILCVCVCVNM